MFSLAESSTNVCSIAPTLLMVVFLFLTLLSTIYDSGEIVQSKYQIKKQFYDMIKVSVIIILNVNVFTVYETLF